MINKQNMSSTVEQILNDKESMNKETMDKESMQVDLIEQTVVENLHLSAKKAATFAKQARALQHNLALRKKQKAERAASEQTACQSNNHHDISHY